MRTFILNTKSEFLKSKRTAAFWLSFLGAGFIPFVYFIGFIAKPDVFVPKTKPDAWAFIISQNWKACAIFLLPMYVILITTLIVQIEYRNNTWKQVYASPRSYADIFFSKFIVTQALILFGFILFTICIIISAYGDSLIQAKYDFPSHSIPWKIMFTSIGNFYISILAITAIQYWLSLRFKNFITSVGIGLALLITGLIIIQWKGVIYYPYMYSALMWAKIFENDSDDFNPQLFSVIWFIIVMSLCYWDISTKKEKG